MNLDILDRQGGTPSIHIQPDRYGSIRATTQRLAHHSFSRHTWAMISCYIALALKATIYMQVRGLSARALLDWPNRNWLQAGMASIRCFVVIASALELHVRPPQIVSKGGWLAHFVPSSRSNFACASIAKRGPMPTRGLGYYDLMTDAQYRLSAPRIAFDIPPLLCWVPIRRRRMRVEAEQNFSSPAELSRRSYLIRGTLVMWRERAVLEHYWPRKLSLDSEGIESMDGCAGDSRLPRLLSRCRDRQSDAKEVKTGRGLQTMPSMAQA
ncbi:hypothetical protein ACRE_009180 [Hapsidospora chrysogenum ATCC 11550]|uniref:Uncharacterized protein n=1 Tax=Hapsidospora chrysogenum (strain ATCC 11550 / CBS 779.69 / DSM 880 / IAM 14645 / JCM 23072 / IMI 49137) TaxID=857340 RepID=A0A086TG53_HAPC1|nr:hypothetical protein ACRE_009180 [Hapsidospora chrysogenum ATCC 11550]